MNTANDKPRIHRVQDEIMNLLSLNSDPMTARDLITLCESHEAESDIHKAVGNLVRAGRIEVAGTTEGARGATARLYRIAVGTDTERLMSHLERDLANAGAGPNIPLDSAHGSTLADEFRSGRIADLSYEPDSIRRHVRPAPNSFAARLIAGLPDPEPRVLGADIWAEVIGAIADRLESGRALPPHPEVIAILRDMRKELLEVAA